MRQQGISPAATTCCHHPRLKTKLTTNCDESLRIFLYAVVFVKLRSHLEVETAYVILPLITRIILCSLSVLISSHTYEHHPVISTHTHTRWLCEPSLYLTHWYKDMSDCQQQSCLLSSRNYERYLCESYSVRDNKI